MSLPPSTANWHWKNKNVTNWGREWFERELVTISVTGDKEGESVSITEVQEVEGDVELGQRKSKLITIYDCKVKVLWQGTASDGSEVHGSLTIPEVSHEITLDGLSDYVYNWSLSASSSPEAETIYKLAKSRLPALLEAKFAEFPVALVDTHGKDLTVSGDPSRSTTPAPASKVTPAAPSVAPRVAAAAPPPPKKADKPLNSVTVSAEASFQASAQDLYEWLTDGRKIPRWAGGSAKSEAKLETDYSLFDGSVSGKYTSLTPYTEIVQTWTLQKNPTWPSEYYGTMTTTLDQSTDSTKVTFSLSGVPIGMENEVRRNLEGYYIGGLKRIGYALFTPATSVYSSSYVETASRSSSKSKVSKQEKDKDTPNSTSFYVSTIVVAALVLTAAFSIPYLSTSQFTPFTK